MEESGIRSADALSLFVDLRHLLMIDVDPELVLGTRGAISGRDAFEKKRLT